MLNKGILFTLLAVDFYVAAIDSNLHHLIGSASSSSGSSSKVVQGKQPIRRVAILKKGGGGGGSGSGGTPLSLHVGSSSTRTRVSYQII